MLTPTMFSRGRQTRIVKQRRNNKKDGMGPPRQPLERTIRRIPESSHPPTQILGRRRRFESRRSDSSWAKRRARTDMTYIYLSIYTHISLYIYIYIYTYIRVCRPSRGPSVAPLLAVLFAEACRGACPFLATLTESPCSSFLLESFD